jgi:hypothetical protein
MLVQKMNNVKPEFNPEDMYHMFDIKRLHNDIWYFKNVLSYPKELLTFINEIDNIEESHKSISKWEPWTASDDKSFVYGKNKNISLSNFENKNNRLSQKMLYIKNSLEMAFDMCLKQYLSGHRLDPAMYNLKINEIPVRQWVGPGMGPHCDTYDGDNDLAFSMIAYINEDYEGGEIAFPNHNISLKPAAGSLVIFPSHEPFLHQVKDIVSGERYTSHLSVYKI